MELKKVTTSDDETEFYCYIDPTAPAVGWIYPCFTRIQAAAYLDATPYSYRFLNANTPLNRRDYPVLVIYFEDEMIVESSPIPTDAGDILEGYYLPGEFVIVK